MKKLLTIENSKSIKKGFSNLAEIKVSGDDDVQFWWEILCKLKNVPNGVTKELLHYIVEHYVVVRGFAFAARWVAKALHHKKKC